MSTHRAEGFDLSLQMAEGKGSSGWIDRASGRAHDDMWTKKLGAGVA